MNYTHADAEDLQDKGHSDYNGGQQMEVPGKAMDYRTASFAVAMTLASAVSLLVFA